MKMLKKELNSAPLQVWHEYNKKESNEDLSNKIILLSSSHMLLDSDIEELNFLIDEERRNLDIAIQTIENNNNISKKIFDIISSLEHDERLKVIVSNMLMMKFLNDGYIDSDDVQKNYIAILEKDVDIVGYKENNEYYKNILDSIDKYNNYKETLPHNHDDDFYNHVCDEEGCIYCEPTTEEERENAIHNLRCDGFFEMEAKEALIKLMVIVMRYEYLLGNSDDYIDLDDDDY